MKVCIVGGTGNISTSITRLLVEVGHEVTLFNRGNTSDIPVNVKVIQGNRADRTAFEEVMQAQNFDAAIDMICFNEDDARSTLRAFRNVKHLVYCSTVCTYGVDYDWLPVTEDHPLRPISDYGRNKVAADRVFMAAYYQDSFPVTIIKPSTTFGPSWSMLRQVDGGNPAWIDRVRKGKPILMCGDGQAMHQWLYVADAAPAFVFTLGRDCCIGQTYHMMKRELGTWAQYQRTAMKVIGHEVEMVGVPLQTLVQAKVPGIDICKSIFSYNTVYSPEKLMRDVPEFRPQVSLEDALARVLEAMDQKKIIPDSNEPDWEDRLIAAQKNIGESIPIS